MFSLEDYLNVSEAYLAGLEKLLHSGGNLSRVVSVASFFVSRVDAAVDKLLPDGSPLRGKIAIANAKAAFVRFRETNESDRFEALKKQVAVIAWTIAWISNINTAALFEALCSKICPLGIRADLFLSYVLKHVHV